MKKKIQNPKFILQLNECLRTKNNMSPSNRHFTKKDHIFCKKNQLYLLFYELNKNSMFSTKFDVKYIIGEQLKIQIFKNLLIKIAKNFEQAHIHYIVLKGFHLMSYYPFNNTRQMKDLDLYVFPEDFDRAVEVLQGLGYTYEYGVFHDKFTTGDGLLIELHRELLKFEQLNVSGVDQSVFFEEQSYFKLGDVVLPGLEISYNLIFQVMHLMVHAVYDGAGMSQLLDISILSIQGVNFDKVDLFFKEIGLYEFYCCLVTAGANFFGTELPETNLKYIKDNCLEQSVVDLMTIIVEGRTDGQYDYAEYMFVKEREYEMKYSQHFHPINYLFPSRSRLTERYRYAKTNPVLLPVAWIHRLLIFILSTKIKDNKLTFYSNNRKRYEIKKELLSRFKILGQSKKGGFNE